MTSYFSGFVDFVGAHPHYALTAVFLLALSEAIPVIGTVVPGSTLIVGISALATGADVNPWLLLVAAMVGAIAGDGLSFWLGQRYHREILLGWPLNRYPRFIDRSEAFINRYGVASVFLARFTAVVRAFVPLVAGILRMPPRQFYAANILSALTWAPAHVFPGVLLGMAISLAGASAEQLTLLIIAGLIVVSAVCWFLPRASVEIARARANLQRMPALIAPVFPELAGNFSSMSPRGFEAPPSASLNVLPFVT
jgi:membrane protein DedA with SNARE-associated domain